MAYSSFDANEQGVVQPTLSWGSTEYEYDFTPNNGTFVNSSGHYYQEELLRAIMPLLTDDEEEEPYFGSNEWDETPNRHESNWFGRCKSIFSWQDNYGIVGDEIMTDNLEKTESNEQCQTRFFCQDQNLSDNYSEASEYDLWSFCDIILGYEGEEICSNYGRDESGISYEPGPGEFAVYEGIFGYWPCLYRGN